MAVWGRAGRLPSVGTDTRSVVSTNSFWRRRIAKEEQALNTPRAQSDGNGTPLGATTGMIATGQTYEDFTKIPEVFMQWPEVMRMQRQRAQKRAVKAASKDDEDNEEAWDEFDGGSPSPFSTMNQFSLPPSAGNSSGRARRAGERLMKKFETLTDKGAIMLSPGSGGRHRPKAGNHWLQGSSGWVGSVTSSVRSECSSIRSAREPQHESDFFGVGDEQDARAERGKALPVVPVGFSPGVGKDDRRYMASPSPAPDFGVSGRAMPCSGRAHSAGAGVRSPSRQTQELSAMILDLKGNLASKFL
eukprot:TRINITY_DN28520_c0_g1_i1.p1 TRINITY_DN28520_c0_g1~~TRINITY_DN28520_c0_g1_i1.p1  ORF type:complete len:302 (-),score=48.38 TRINITY_DN28520_c0_g1_i1:52-957(-)